MAKEYVPRWVARDEVWVVPLGSYDEKRKRYRSISLRHENGEKVARHDQAGKIAALSRLLEVREKAKRDSVSPTVAVVVRAYLAWHRRNGSAERTIADHLKWLGVFGSFEYEGVAYCDRPASEVDVQHLARIKTAMLKRGNDLSYIRHLYMSVRACWAWAARPIEDREPLRYLDRNPFDKLQVPSPGTSDEKFVMPAAIFAFIDFLRARKVHPNGAERWRKFSVAFQLIALSGCRPSEAAELRWSEIRWDEGVVVIPAKQRRASGRRHKTGRKTGKPRIIMIDDSILEQLEALHGEKDRHPEYAFWTGARPTTRRLGEWYALAREKAQAAGIQLEDQQTLYWFRHTWQTIGVEAESADLVSLASGNTRQVSMGTYVHSRSKLVRDVSGKVLQRMKQEAGKD